MHNWWILFSGIFSEVRHSLEFAMFMSCPLFWGGLAIHHLDLFRAQNTGNPHMFLWMFISEEISYTHMTPIFEGQPSKRRPFPIKNKGQLGSRYNDYV